MRGATRGAPARRAPARGGPAAQVARTPGAARARRGPGGPIASRATAAGCPPARAPPAGYPSERDLQAVVRGENLHPMIDARDLLEAPRLREQRGQALIVRDRLVMIEAEAAGAGELAHLHAD